MKKKNKIFIVAEAGNNHEGSFLVAKKLVDAASKAGADAIKFQTIDVKKFISKTNKIRFELLKKFSLTLNDFKKLSLYCKKKKIIFFSSVFDLDSVNYLNKIQNYFKISSGDNNFYDLIKKVAKLNKELIISTGGADLDQIVKIYNIVKNIRKRKKLQLSFLHCVSSYPAELDQINLLSIIALKNKFPDVNIGFSDHTSEINTSVHAVLVGAKIIEKHFTLDNNFSSFRDHKIALNPKNFKEMVNRINEATITMGKEEKVVQKSEKKILITMRRSAHIKNAIVKGAKLNKTNIIFLRPGNGITNENIRMYYGKKVNKNINAGKMLNKKNFY